MVEDNETSVATQDEYITCEANQDEPVVQTRSTEERDALIIKHLDLAEREAKKRHRTVSQAVQLGDLLSAAYLGLLDAAARFDEKKVNADAKQPFPCYARRRIQGEMNDYLRSCNWGTRTNPRRLASLDQSLYQEKGGWADSPRPLKEMLTSATPAVVDQLNGSQLFNKVIRGLPPFAKGVFRLRYCEDLTMKQVADRLGISESRVSQILSQHSEYLGEVLASKRCELWEEASGVRNI